MPIELVKFKDLKNILGLIGNEEAGYPGLKILKDKILNSIESYLGYELEQKERAMSEYIHCPRQEIILNALPINSVSSVCFDTSIELDHSNYEITSYGIKLKQALSTTLVQVKWIGGYKQENIPNPIKRAALLQTIFEYQDNDMELPPLLLDAKVLLNPYKHPYEF